MAPWSQEVEHLRRLEYKRAYLELMIERYGDERGFRMQEADALRWVLDLLGDTNAFAADVEVARRLVSERPPTLR